MVLVLFNEGLLCCDDDDDDGEGAAVAGCSSVEDEVVLRVLLFIVLLEVAVNALRRSHVVLFADNNDLMGLGEG